VPLSLVYRFRPLVPGLALAALIALAAMGLEKIETAFTGFPWIDGLVLAIVAGTVIHTFCGLPARFAQGVQFASKTVLEIAVVLLGVSVSVSALTEKGPAMIVAVAAVVAASLAISYGIGRLLGLPHRLATLVACGNSICGNSAIVAAAPVIAAESEDVAASIAFTAALGILVVLLLPLAFTAFGLTQWQYGVVAGMTVYAVPQVLAATVPIGPISAQTGTIVKLMRVLMLGPVVLLLGLGKGRATGPRPALSCLVPWFIVGFLGAMAARTTGAIPEAALTPCRDISTLLTIVSMAGLGLSVNLKTVLASGGRVLAAGILSLTALALLSAVTLTLLPAA
jgi:uncharacterized integral membrane protein (TIGR00698 family)